MKKETKNTMIKLGVNFLVMWVGVGGGIILFSQKRKEESEGDFQKRRKNQINILATGGVVFASMILIPTLIKSE